MNKKRVLIVLAVLVLLILVWGNFASGLGEGPAKKGYIWVFGLRIKFKEPEEIVVKAAEKPAPGTVGPRVQ